MVQAGPAPIKCPETTNGSFSSWWWSAPRATYNRTIDTSIDPALNDDVYPNYDTTNSRWSITAVDCSTVKYQATIPVSNLVLNSSSDCHKNDSIFCDHHLWRFGVLRHPLRQCPSSHRLFSGSSGYFRSTFGFPFTFSMQTTVSNIVGTSSKWAFSVSVLNSLVTYTGSSPNYMLNCKLPSPLASLTSPNVSAWTLLGFPYSAQHIGADAPTLNRLTDNETAA